MKILVCISNVPDTTSKINFTESDTKFDTNGVQFVINPNDEFGLTRAMWFKEKQGATVHVANVGGAQTEPTIRKALAIGADEAIDGGKEKIKTTLPLVIGGQKGLVEESDLRIPNMRGIMMARKKALNVVEPVDAPSLTEDKKFEKPAAKGPVKLVDAGNVEELVNLLHNEAKVI